MSTTFTGVTSCANVESYFRRVRWPGCPHPVSELKVEDGTCVSCLTLLSWACKSPLQRPSQVGCSRWAIPSLPWRGPEPLTHIQGFPGGWRQGSHVQMTPPGPVSVSALEGPQEATVSRETARWPALGWPPRQGACGTSLSAVSCVCAATSAWAPALPCSPGEGGRDSRRCWEVITSLFSLTCNHR